jgi:hypothetical protein
MNNNWVKQGNNYFIREISQNKKQIQPAVYKINADPMSGEVYITHIQDKFEFPYKIYGIESNFINRVIKTYHNTNSNLGLLLNGVKGTGKTVTAKQICNELELPVLIIHESYDNIPSFINQIQQNVIILIDEFEKIYQDRDHSVLTIMDGVMDNGFRKVFILTTNELYINANLIQRPGRIRYLKTYSDLTLEIINEIVDDKLIYTNHKEDTIEFISQLETITVDIVKSIIDEVNIHNEPPSIFGDVFNIKKLDDVCNIYEIKTDGQPELIHSNEKIKPVKITKKCIGQSFKIVDVETLGSIANVLDENNIIVDTWEWDEKAQKDIKISKHYMIESLNPKHHVFAF